MKLYSEGKNYKLYGGSMLDMLEVIEPCTIDSIVTDPPYELGFMNKGWDASGVAFQPDTWAKCLEVLKPGGYLLAFGGTRTYHRIACAIEDAGFEIRDTIMWLYGQGFPKSMNISKGIEAKETYGKASTEYKRIVEQSGDGEEYTVMQTNNGCIGETHEATRKVYEPQSEIAKRWDGWGTCLKPAYEPVIVARKPCEGSCVDNVLKYGVGGINIDECKIGTDTITTHAKSKDDSWFGMIGECPESEHVGRFPSNVILTYGDDDFDEVCGGMPYTSSSASGYNFDRSSQDNVTHLYTNIKSGMHFADEGSASRYFYCAKASARDRDEGCEHLEDQSMSMMANGKGTLMIGAASLKGEHKEVQPKKNIHPTVKPCELMQYLVRLVTPKGGTVLDPFNGSGSTGKATMYENRDRQAKYKYIGIELTPEYLPIADARIRFVENRPVQFKLF